MEFDPFRLLVRQVHGPRYGRVFGGDFLNKIAVLVIAKQPKPGRLALDPALRVPVTTVRPTMRSRCFRADEEFGRTVANTRNADGGMDLDGSDLFHLC